MTILKTFIHKGKTVEQLYFGGQDIRYRVDGKILTSNEYYESIGKQ